LPVATIAPIVEQSALYVTLLIARGLGMETFALKKGEIICLFSQMAELGIR